MAAARQGRACSDAEDHQGVGGHRPVAGHDERVDVDLGDLGEVDGDAAQRGDHRAQLSAVDRGRAPERPEQLLGPDEVGELGDVALTKGDDSKRDIAQHLGHDAAEAEGHHRSEHRVPLEPGQQFPVAGDHLLHEDALQGGAGPFGHEPVGGAHGRRISAGMRSCTRPPSVL